MNHSGPLKHNFFYQVASLKAMRLIGFRYRGVREQDGVVICRVAYSDQNQNRNWSQQTLGRDGVDDPLW